VAPDAPVAPVAPDSPGAPPLQPKAAMATTNAILTKAAKAPVFFFVITISSFASFGSLWLLLAESVLYGH
jgi:hypothetical protein